MNVEFEEGQDAQGSHAGGTEELQKGGRRLRDLSVNPLDKIFLYTINVPAGLSGKECAE